MSGSVERPHSRPNYGKTVRTSAELLEYFGLRIMPSGATNQSWCRACRSKAQRK
ncbi:hypothetical protein [Providencia burhodogranariea]|uniref:hypothetical protein n=1 Tax=Providencia burhodogranariea TaxID=516074 RepID=UPI00130EF3AF|nr:hypothetical protein [Providencia burhodogranariea]